MSTGDLARLGAAASRHWSYIFLTFVPFGLGAFPLSDIFQSLRKLNVKLLKLDPGGNTAQANPLFALQGLTKEVNDRLVAEDITTIGQLAYCDPVQLSMRSNLSFNFVVDIVSQALIWQYFGEKLAQARPYGIRTSFEVITLMEASHESAPSLRCRAIDSNILLTVNDVRQ